MLDAAACQHDDGTVTLFLVNISKTIPLQLELPNGCVPLRSVRLSASGFDATNALNRECVQRMEREEKGRNISLPAGTVCAVTIKLTAE